MIRTFRIVKGGKMIPKYRKRANISISIWLVSAVIMFVVAKSIDSLFVLVLLVFNAVFFYYAMRSYAIAKGYSGAAGLGLALLSIPGLVIVLSMRDKTIEETEVDVEK